MNQKYWYFEQAKENLLLQVNLDEVENYFLVEGWMSEKTPKFNERWNDFKTKVDQDCVIWSYSFGGPLSRRFGYAIVKHNVVIDCFQTGMS